MEPFVVGINHPWVACGHDFGPRPPPWKGAGPTDWKSVEAELRRYAELGVRVVRWWVLAGGVNYPVGESPFAYALAKPIARNPERGKHLVPTARVPTLPPEFLKDFESLLSACRVAGVKLLPSLTSFEFFLPLRSQDGGVVGRGRGPWAVDTKRRVDEFLDATLEPILDTCKRHREHVFAIEVMNEPDWLIRLRRGFMGWLARWGFQTGLPDHVALPKLAHFLRSGLDRIVSRGFVATIGFVRPDLAWLPAGLTRHLHELGARGDYVHQVHHYPSDTNIRVLPSTSELPVEACLVGEFATAKPNAKTRWHQEGLAEDDAATYLEARLHLCRKLGYRGALLWSGRGRDHHTAFGSAQQQQLARFAQTVVSG